MTRSKLISLVVDRLSEDSPTALQEWAELMIRDHNITNDELWREQARQHHRHV